MSPTISEVRRAIQRSLESASEALLRGDTRGMAERLRDAWRESRDKGLAQLYAVLVRASAPTLSGRDPSERARAWGQTAKQAAGDPLMLPCLLDEPSHEHMHEYDRLRAFSAWTPDPLLATGLVRRLQVPVTLPGKLEDPHITAETIRLLAAQRDPRVRALERLQLEPKTRQRRLLQATIDELKKISPVRLDPDALAAAVPLERRAAEVREREARSAALLEAVYAQPDADAPRLVYADWLASLGDPRGEFISLQVARQQHGGPPSERERELLARHVDEWAGPLHTITGPVRVYERGFLAAVSLERAIDELEFVTAPEWANIRSLDGIVSETLLQRGRLDRLRTLYGFRALPRFIELRAAGRLESVERYECSLNDPNLRFDTPLGLRSLLIHHALDDQLLALLNSPACEGLEELAIYYQGSSLSGVHVVSDHRERPHLRTRAELLRRRLPVHVRSLCLLDGVASRASRPQGATLHLERDTVGALSRLCLDVHAVHYPAPRSIDAEAVVALLDELPLASLSHIRLGEIDETVCSRADLHAALLAAKAPIAP